MYVRRSSMPRAMPAGGCAMRSARRMQKRGLTVVHLDAQAVDLWRKTAEGVYPQLRDSFVPAAAFDEARKLRDEYRKQKAHQ